MYYITAGLTGIIPIVGLIVKDEEPLFCSFLKTKDNKLDLKIMLEMSNKKQTIFKRTTYSRENIVDIKFVAGKLSFMSNERTNLKDSEIVTYGNLAALSNLILIEDSNENLREKLKDKIVNIFQEKSPLPIVGDVVTSLAEKIIDNNLLEALEVISIDAFPYQSAYYLDINAPDVMDLILKEMVFSYGESQFIELFKRAPRIKSLLFMTDPSKFSMKTWPKVLDALGGKDGFESKPDSQQKSIIYAYEVFGEDVVELIGKIQEINTNIDFYPFKELSVIKAKTKFKIDTKKVLKTIKRIDDPMMINSLLSSLEDAEFREFLHQKGEISLAKLTAELMKRQYTNVKPGGEPMAIVAADIMMSQNSFEQYQNEYINAMEKLPFMSRHYPTVSSSPIGGYSYESMDMGNPRGWVVGIETHCCQHLGSAGSSCVRYAASNPDVSGMFRVIRNGKTKAQSWFWFHEESGTFVFDNIEVAGGTGIDELGEDTSQKIIDTYMAFIDNELVPRANLFGIKRVTVGLGYSDLNLDMPNVERPVTISKMKNSSNVYSDAGRQKIMKEIHEISL